MLKIILLLATYQICVSNTFILNEAAYDFKNSEQTWALIPAPDGGFRLENINKLYRNAKIYLAENLDVTFKLYTRKRKEGEYIKTNKDVRISDLSSTTFDGSIPTRIIIHGWKNNGSSAINTKITEAYLSRGSFNIIVVDWGLIANTNNYLEAKLNIPSIADSVTKFLQSLNSEGHIPYKDIYLIGHSLGAHICGLIGKNIKEDRLNTIFGLDPAYPLFLENEINNRLHHSDAMYVEVIHTNAGILGYKTPIGQSSFYANWGTLQPGCGIDLFGLCSHSRSYLYFAESIAIENSFFAIPCQNFGNIEEKNCQLDAPKVRMAGDPSNKYSKGIFYVPTASDSPYGKGGNFS